MPAEGAAAASSGGVGAAARVGEDTRVRAALRAVSTSSATTKALGGILVGSYLASTLLPGAADALALVPDKTIPRVWNVFTAGYFETNFLVMLCNVSALLYLGRRIEPVWGAREFVHFTTVVNLSVGTSTFFVMYVLYVLTQDQYYLFAKFGGFQGVTAALLVALHQTAPDEPLGALGLRHAQLSGAFVLTTLLLTLSSGALHHHIGLFLFVLFGTYYGWLYLRFFQPVAVACGARAAAGATGAAAGASQLRGDPREEFSFASLWPEPMQPAIERLSAPAYACCCRPAAGGDATRGVGAPAGGARVNEAPLGSESPTRGGARGSHAPPAAGGGGGSESARQRELAARGMRLLEARMSTAGAAASPQPRASRAPAAPPAPQPAQQPTADEAV